VLALAEAITDSAQDVGDELFARVERHFSPEQLVELTAWICLENFYSKFNRTFRIEAQGFCVIP
jgi:alkylhydroperoxidase family enzyme